MVADVVLVGFVTFALAPGKLALVLVTTTVAALLIGTVGGYRFGEHMTADRLDASRRLGVAVIVTAWTALMAGDWLGARLSALDSLTLVLGLVPLLVGVRAILRALYPPPIERVVVLGSGMSARRIADLSTRHLERRFEVLGCLDAHPEERVDGDPPHLGSVHHLPALLARGEVDRVVVAFGSAGDDELLALVRRCDAFGVPVDAVPRFFELIGHKPETYRIGGTPLLAVKRQDPSAAQRVGKRALDIVGAGTVLALTAIPCVLIAAVIKLSDRGPVFFRQRRIGKNEAPFDVLKFRTMVLDADRIGNERIAGLKDGTMSVADAVTALKPANDDRITRIGRLLRATSLDELPQLINVLRGEMSLVGPRPLRDFEVEGLSGWERDRQQVAPGLTGLWQVSGRSAVGWEERMGMDYLYVRHRSLDGDLRIICETVPALLARRGAQ
jgi:exopolysaccharide biosynthesis polyprenyl glycosylphosphotransferase